MKLFVGLGNPGKEYEKCRHNTGFMILDKIAEEKGLKWKKSLKFDSIIAESEEMIIVKPQTFMNKSGTAVSKIINFYKIPFEDVVVIHDDVDLELGVVKKQKGKNAAGHHGVEDIIDKLGTKSFWRIRVGIGKPENKNIAVDKWVLQNFDEKELLLMSGLRPEFLINQLETFLQN